MSLFKSTPVFLLSLVLFSTSVLAQTPRSQAKSDPLNNTSYVSVMISGKSGVIKIFKPKVVNAYGQRFLSGLSSLENSKEIVMINWNSVDSIRYPNPAYEKPIVKKETINIDQIPLRFRIDRMENDLSRKEAAVKDLSRQIAQKQIKSRNLKREIKAENDPNVIAVMELEQKLLSDELAAHQAKLDELKAEFNNSKIEFLKKRRDAIVNGELDD